MKKILTTTIVLLLAYCGAKADTGIIPLPKKVTPGEGVLATWSMKKVKIRKDKALAPEAYVLDIQPSGITIKASTDRAVLYARQSLMQLAEQDKELPCMTIEDEPTYQYRGFMLDVSRHFFSVDEVKRMLDVMARYKMNVFHWHLTDDQGWRAEIKRYPKLTTIGAQRSNNYETYIHRVEENGQTYWTGIGGNTGEPYGPYYYTQAEMRDVVRYAAERGIDVLPEIDMPGHFVAALTAYPEFRCEEQPVPSVWHVGGVSQNVLNVANPKAVEFAKHIIDELCDIFPYPYFHIGGDECPTTAWEANGACQALYKQQGLTSYHQLQTRFIGEIDAFLKKKGKKLFCWNESVTAPGADLDIMKRTGATIMSWYPCEAGIRKAVSLGLPTVCTEFDRGNQSYYINRRQCTDYGEPTAAGDGNDSAEGCYSLVPMPAGLSAEEQALVIGVQGTFWTEQVGTDEYLEYLALPRLMCVAEAGWSRQDQKDWTSFQSRLMQHRKWLDENGYTYSRHWMPGYTLRENPYKAAVPELSAGSQQKWYKIQFTRTGVCLQSNGTDFCTTALDLQQGSSQSNAKNSLFCLIPTDAEAPSLDRFQLQSADGYWIAARQGKATNGQTATLLYGTTDRSEAAELCLQRHPADKTAYVISRIGDKATGFNTWGGAGVGFNIGFYAIADGNDKLIFLLGEKSGQ